MKPTDVSKSSGINIGANANCTWCVLLEHVVSNKIDKVVVRHAKKATVTFSTVSSAKTIGYIWRKKQQQRILAQMSDHLWLRGHQYALTMKMKNSYRYIQMEIVKV